MGSKPNAASDTATTLTLDMDRHPINCIVEIAAGIPDWRVGLDASLAVSRTRSNRILARFRRFPFQIPHPPRIARFFCSELGGLPRSASIGGDFHLHHIRLSGPGNSLNIERA